MDRSPETDETAIVLVGGLGSRLGSLTADIPKPMLPVGGRPFVEYVLIHLAQHGFRTVIFASGYRSERLHEYFQDGSRLGLMIRYSDEVEPLGTGGAIHLASRMVDGDRFLVVNGDSFLDGDPRSVLDAVEGDIITSMAITQVADGRRYGSVERSKEGSVVGFAPRGAEVGPTLINAGVYGMSARLIDMIPAEGESSLERDVLPRLVGRGLVGLPFDGFFIDIGIPTTYAALQADPGPILRAVDVRAIV